MATLNTFAALNAFDEEGERLVDDPIKVVTQAARQIKKKLLAQKAAAKIQAAEPVAAKESSTQNRNARVAKSEGSGKNSQRSEPNFEGNASRNPRQPRTTNSVTFADTKDTEKGDHDANRPRSTGHHHKAPVHGRAHDRHSGSVRRDSKKKDGATDNWGSVNVPSEVSTAYALEVAEGDVDENIESEVSNGEKANETKVNSSEGEKAEGAESDEKKDSEEKLSFKTFEQFMSEKSATKKKGHRKVKAKVAKSVSTVFTKKTQDEPKAVVIDRKNDLMSALVNAAATSAGSSNDSASKSAKTATAAKKKQAKPEVLVFEQRPNPVFNRRNNEERGPRPPRSDNRGNRRNDAEGYQPRSENGKVEGNEEKKPYRRYPKNGDESRPPRKEGEFRRPPHQYNNDRSENGQQNRPRRYDNNRRNDNNVTSSSEPHVEPSW